MKKIVIKKRLAGLSASLFLATLLTSSVHAGLFQEQYGDVDPEQSRTLLLSTLKQHLSNIRNASHPTNTRLYQEDDLPELSESVIRFFDENDIPKDNIAFVDALWSQAKPAYYERFNHTLDCVFFPGQSTALLEKLFHDQYDTLLDAFKEPKYSDNSVTRFTFAVAHVPYYPDQLHIAACHYSKLKRDSPIWLQCFDE